MSLSLLQSILGYSLFKTGMNTSLGSTCTQSRLVMLKSRLKRLQPHFSFSADFLSCNLSIFWKHSAMTVFSKLHQAIYCYRRNFRTRKISYSSVGRLSYARNFRTAMVVSDALVYVYGFRMLLNFVHSAKSTKYTKLNRVWKFVRLQYPKPTIGLVCTTSWYPKCNGSHFGLPPALFTKWLAGHGWQIRFNNDMHTSP